MKLLYYITFLTLSLRFDLSFCQSSPSLILTEQGVQKVKSHLGQVPIFDNTLEKVKSEVNQAIQVGIKVPIPKDLAGGYTHEQHKSNFFLLQKAGVLFQITGDETYANYIKEMLFVYKEMYPTIDRHPETRSYARGKLFWQCLNDANWLVYASQAYDCIYGWLSPEERDQLNKDLFRPMADFLSVETPQFFNRIHNHSTWGNAAVGMIGLVINDEELVKRALYGLDKQVAGDIIKDNDGGLIELPGQEEAGFLAQINHAFSPDGYYTEGPYYQRYAIYPFLIFAQALQNKRPESQIFEYRDGVLLKGVSALLNLTNSSGAFFPINDCQKGMSYLSRELVTAVSLAYHYGEQNPALLSIIEKQNRVPLNDTGIHSALAIVQGISKPFVQKSIQLRDGAEGDEGALGILRASANDETEEQFSAVMKYAKHGMGHGHFDKLSFSYYRNSREILQDYGSARWVNVEQKDGGGYLKENRSWAKQTVAHNTVVINQTSQFKANTSEADKHHGTPFFFDSSNEKIQVMSAMDTNSYPGIKLHRTMALIKSKAFEYPILLDLFQVDADSPQEVVELPFYYSGQVMQTNFDYKMSASLNSIGENYGYQHLWKEALGKPKDSVMKFNWLLDNQFYTLTSAVDVKDEMIFGRIGANDPHFNLRRDPVFIIRKKDINKVLFASIVEAHGAYSPITELAQNTYSNVKAIKVLYDEKGYSVVQFSDNQQRKWVFALANQNNSKTAKHHLQTDQLDLEWEGVYVLTNEFLEP
ncbi:MAG: heparinase II/III family protein [Bacteroidota bacterium]